MVHRGWMQVNSTGIDKMRTRYTDWREVPLVLTLKEAAAVMDVHPNTVHNLIKGKELEAQKVGREWRITKQAIMTYLRIAEA